jgi:hypothetical protein
MCKFMLLLCLCIFIAGTRIKPNRSRIEAHGFKTSWTEQFSHVCGPQRFFYGSQRAIQKSEVPERISFEGLHTVRNSSRSQGTIVEAKCSPTLKKLLSTWVCEPQEYPYVP